MGIRNSKPRSSRSFLIDLALLLALAICALLFAGVAERWAAPFRAKSDIQLGIVPLMSYSFLSLVRVVLAYFLSLAFTLTYGYWAAKSRYGDAILIPILDILQSVPVLGFMPGLVLALVSLFPHSNIGLELAAIVMIFTGEGWNMVFSFYSSVKSVPTEWKELGQMMRLSPRDFLRQVEIPYSVNGLLWNSMLSMAGGWFFLMTIESFSLGDKDFRLPGLGAYMAVAYERGDVWAVISGMTSMLILIVLVDRCVWAPLLAWSEKFKMERDLQAPRSLVLDWLQNLDLVRRYQKSILRAPLKNLLKQTQKTAEKGKSAVVSVGNWLRVARWAGLVWGIGCVIAVFWGASRVWHLVVGVGGVTWLYLLWQALLTTFRVALAVFLGSLWAIPLGVWIGTHPRWTHKLQPIVQVVASFPAPMLFPLITLVLVGLGISIEFGSVILLLFASQWYILFNVIGGAILIPRSILEMSELFQIKGWTYWKSVIIPAIFPALVNGWISAAGGAWNASIVSEWVMYENKKLVATGIGAAITQAAERGDFANLAAAVVVMVLFVVLLNRFFWNALYRLAETRFRLN